MRKFIKSIKSGAVSTGNNVAKGAKAVGHASGKVAIVVGQSINSSLLSFPATILGASSVVIGSELDRLSDMNNSTMLKPRKHYRKLRVREQEAFNKVITGDVSPKDYVESMIPESIKLAIEQAKSGVKGMSRKDVDNAMHSHYPTGANSQI